MPPKQIITKEQILDSAYRIVIKSGMEGITARNIAKQLNCSTQPIYWYFDNKEDLLHCVYLDINKRYIAKMFELLDKDDFFMGITKWLLDITQQSRYLFGVLFYYVGFDDENLFDVMRSLKDDAQIISKIKAIYHLGNNGAKYLYIACSNILWASVDRQIGRNTAFKTDEDFFDFMNSFFAEFIKIAKLKD